MSRPTNLRTFLSLKVQRFRKDRIQKEYRQVVGSPMRIIAAGFVFLLTHFLERKTLVLRGSPKFQLKINDLI